MSTLVARDGGEACSFDASLVCFLSPIRLHSPISTRIFPTRAVLCCCCCLRNNNNKLGPYFDPTYTRTGWIGQPPVLDRHEVVTDNGDVVCVVKLKVVEHTKKWVKCSETPSYLWISSRLKLGLVSLGNQTNLEFERLSTTEFGVVAGEASTTLPGLWCECAKSRAARQNRRG